VFVRVHLWLFIACFLLATNCNPAPSSNSSRVQTPQPTPAGTPEASYEFGSVDQLLQRIAPRHGGVALVLIKDGKVIYRKSFGSHTAEKVVPVASASKWLSGAVIMSLVDEGKLSLDDTVSKYLPEFDEEKSGITIRQLFSHTSGLPAEARCRNDKRTTLERCASEIAGLRLAAAPGEEFFYGGVSMHVGGRIAEVVSGKSWNDLFVERIATPLGMTQTDFFSYGPTSNPRPAGDARSSADEYGRFLQMLVQQGSFDGKQILSAASVAEMHKDQTGGARIEYTIYENHRDLDPNLLLARYGIGMWREKFDTNSGRLQELSSQGYFGFSPWIDVERNLAAVLSVQSRFSRVMPDYLELKKEIRRIVPADNRPLPWQ
jgi:CubicO group peptidase (beta-lactamase class C family)